MVPPIAHWEYETGNVEYLKYQKSRQLRTVLPKETVNCPKDQHPDCIGDWVADQSVDPGSPVVEDVLRTLATQVVAEKNADYREPDNEEVDQVVDNVQNLVPGRETESLRDLTEEQETEVLEIPVEQHRRQEDQEAERTKEDGNAVVKEQFKAEPQKHEGN